MVIVANNSTLQEFAAESKPVRPITRDFTVAYISLSESGYCRRKIPIVADAYYTRKDLEDLGICGWLTALRHEKKGKLKACRIGRLVRYRGADIIQWLEGCKS